MRRLLTAQKYEMHKIMLFWNIHCCSKVKEMNTFIQQGYIKFVKSDSKKKKNL